MNATTVRGEAQVLLMTPGTLVVIVCVVAVPLAIVYFAIVRQLAAIAAKVDMTWRLLTDARGQAITEPLHRATDVEDADFRTRRHQPTRKGL